MVCHHAPKKAAFLFDPALKMKIKEYQINAKQIVLIAEHQDGRKVS